jgi:hypothetical protein
MHQVKNSHSSGGIQVRTVEIKQNYIELKLEHDNKKCMYNPPLTYIPTYNYLYRTTVKPPSPQNKIW